MAGTWVVTHRDGKRVDLDHVTLNIIEVRRLATDPDHTYRVRGACGKCARNITRGGTCAGCAGPESTCPCRPPDRSGSGPLGLGVLGQGGLLGLGVLEKEGNAEYDRIRVGSRVTILTPQRQRRTGRAVMMGPAGWVLNMGGKHGRPAIASPRNVVQVT